MTDRISHRAAVEAGYADLKGYIEKWGDGMKNIRFTCPESMKVHVQKVFDGEYAIPYRGTPDMKILDIGGNCGAFAVWAKLTYPDAKIFSYEPFKDNCGFFVINTDGMSGIYLHEKAVGDPTKTKLYLGKNNCGECSQYKGDEQVENFVEIDVISPRDMDLFDIVKLDCEGAEEYILPRLDLSATKFVMFEYHSESSRRTCDDVLFKQGFSLIQMNVTSIGQGIAKYFRSNQ